MAVVYYPKQSILLKRDTVSASYEQVVLTTQPNTILYFGSNSLEGFSASVMYITASNALTASLVVGTSSYALNSNTSSWANDSVSSSYSNIVGFPVITLSGSSHYSMSSSDVFKHLRINNLTNVNLWIQPQSSASYVTDAEVVIEQLGLGSVTVSGSLNVTVNNSTTYLRKTYEQYSVIGLKRVSNDVWTMFGDRAIA